MNERVVHEVVVFQFSCMTIWKWGTRVHTHRKKIVGLLLLLLRPLLHYCVLHIGHWSNLIKKKRREENNAHNKHNIVNKKEKTTESNTIPSDCNFQCSTQMKMNMIIILRVNCVRVRTLKEMVCYRLLKVLNFRVFKERKTDQKKCPKLFLRRCCFFAFFW